jgi:hypothetical protein
MGQRASWELKKQKYLDFEDDAEVNLKVVKRKIIELYF